MVLPNFLIIGAAKSGTTALYYYLKQHPQIYLSPIKEPHFFGLEGKNPNFKGSIAAQYENQAITNLKDYLDLFADVDRESAIGEVSNSYLYLPEASDRIKHYLPDVKLIAMLRNPVERAYSSFLHTIREGDEPLEDFALALQAEAQRIAEENWGFLHRYQDMGFYAQQLKRYYDLFEPKQIKVYLYDDFKNNAVEVVQDLFRFIEVEPEFVPDMSTQFNISGIPKNKKLYKFLTGKNSLKTIVRPFLPDNLRYKLINSYFKKELEKPQLSLQLRQKLINLYREDILQLQDLLDRDLSAWLE